MTTFVLVSSLETTYVIDTRKLGDKTSELMILLFDHSVMKFVNSNFNDLKGMQRDFNIYCSNVLPVTNTLNSSTRS